uniref:DUF2513 domain-containing protein n=1 Tax=Serratia marcescens TaxID=615 RepID=A0A1C3HHK6_SERMA|nr:Uncharacterised protein [Serratia marcescens]
MTSNSNEFNVLVGKIFCRLLDMHPQPQMLIFDAFFDFPDDLERTLDMPECRSFFSCIKWLKQHGYVDYSGLISVAAMNVTITEKTLIILNALPKSLQQKQKPLKDALLDAAKTGKNAVIAECVSRIFAYSMDGNGSDCE